LSASRAGRWYYRAITAVSTTAAALAAMRWAQDWYLLVIGAVAFAAATAGYLHRRLRRTGDIGHIAGMGIAYTVMLTAFYVDNGPHLPLWGRLPALAFWLLPSAIAAPHRPRHHQREERGRREVRRWREGLAGCGQAGRETADPVAEIGDGRVEAGRVAGRDRVGDRPVDRGLAAEFFPGQVADRDHQVAVVLDVADVPGPEPGQRQAVAAGSGDRAGIDPFRGPGAG